MVAIIFSPTVLFYFQISKFLRNIIDHGYLLFLQAISASQNMDMNSNMNMSAVQSMNMNMNAAQSMNTEQHFLNNAVVHQQPNFNNM